LPSILHPSASIVPTTLAAAQLVGASGAQALDAAAVGIELCARLGMAGYNEGRRSNEFFERGQHATSICGAVAGAAAAARLMGLGADGAVHAMGIAASMGAGLLEANRSGGTVKRLHCGIAARSAVTAAQLAKRGFTGPETVLEGRFGFFQAWIDGNFDVDSLTQGLGSQWETTGIFFKPYPCNHFTHTGIDAAKAIRETLQLRGIPVTSIESISLGVASQTVRTIGEPLEAKQTPATGYLAKFSGPFTVAAALVGGSGLGLGLDDFTDHLATDPTIRSLASKVSVVADPDCDAIYPMQFPTVLTVTTPQEQFTERVMTNRGGPQRPLTDDELLIKFRDCANRVLPSDEVTALETACLQLETASNVDAIFAATANAKES
jgi:2-methylcitrate dehydratase PrpD